MQRQCASSVALAASWAEAPPSIWSDRYAIDSAVIVLSTVLTIETFCDEPTARNSKRPPPYAVLKRLTSLFLARFHDLCAVFFVQFVAQFDRLEESKKRRETGRSGRLRNGDVRLRSCAGMSKGATASTPMSSSFFLGTYSVGLPLMKSFRYPVISYQEIFCHYPGWS